MQTYTLVFVILTLCSVLTFKTAGQTKLKSKIQSKTNFVQKSKLSNKNKRWDYPKYLKFKQDDAKDDSPVIKEGWARFASDTIGNINTFPPVPQDDHTKPDEDLKLLNSKAIREMDKQLWNKGSFRKNTQKATDPDIPTCDSFYFRLTKTQLFYTETDKDTLVLGSLDIEDITKTLPYLPKGCFKITDKHKKAWMMCSTDGTCPKEWKEAINTAIGQSNNEQCPEDEPDPDLYVAPQMIIPVAAANCKYDWNYNYHGQNWVCHCNEGLEQSPIDLPSNKTLDYLEANAEFDYDYIDPSNLTMVYDTNMLRIRTVEGVIFGTMTDVDGQTYEAYEVQFHTPGEHMYMGYQIDMEVEVIHRAVDGEVRRQAVLSFLFRRTPGAISNVWDTFDMLNLPNPIYNKGDDIIKAPFNVLQFIYETQTEVEQMFDFSYYKYQGSRTAPPCEEFTTWFVVDEILPVSSTLLTMIRDVLNIPLQNADSTNLNFDGSNRMVQPLRSRKVYYYDPQHARFGNVKPIHPNDEQPDGHYELITKNAKKYFTVDGFQPSGIQGALVVGKEEAESLPDPEPRITDQYDIHQ